ncbi:MAG: OmpA family protein [Methylophilus sp.]|nr:OmpA family protein [Methylophilus sp.]
MHNHQSCYSRWTWVVALILALILLLMLLTGNGPSSDCCGSAKPVEAVAPASAPVITESFGFTAHCSDFTSKGDASAWTAQADKLKSILCSGEALQAEGDEKHVLLTGIVDSDAAKVKVGEELQAIFGASLALENQISVKTAEPVAIDQTPSAAKLYFDIAKTNLPSTSNDSLAPIVAWLKAHPNTKAVISGFHDASGNKELNHQIAKARAKSTFDALVAAGVDAANIEMRKPTETLGTGDPKEARRVEVSVE